MKNQHSKPINNLILGLFVTGPLLVNTYVVADPDTKEAVLIDPGGGVLDIRRFIDKNGLELKFIINTHGHGDHIAIDDSFDVPVYVHKLDGEFLKDAGKNLSGSFGFPITVRSADRLLQDGDILKLGRLKLEVIHTPGHTPGSISVKVDSTVFTGDALFAGSIGRTDFNYGDGSLLIRSIKEKLLTLPDETVIYPGHGPSSTIGEERRSNPFL